MTAPAQNRTKTATRRVIGRPFEKGNRANPGGRPKGLAAAIREQVPAGDLARYFSAIWHRDVAELEALNIPLHDVTLEQRTKAGDWLADRGYGKAPIHAPVEGGDPLELTAVDAAIAGGLDELAERRETPASRRDPASPLAAPG